jgi:carbamoyl-phosphate synthase small subunit
MGEKKTKAYLVFEDGSIFEGYSFGYEGNISGEVVFSTGMTGYTETLTDKSYNGQILVLTYPLIGNYGVPNNEEENGMSKYFESEKVQVSGLIISDYSFNYSHWNASKSLSEWLIENKIPAIYNIDTRLLTKKLREKGTLLGKIIIHKDEINFDKIKSEEFFDPDKFNLVEKVSIKGEKIYGNGKIKILLIDCGVKNNIIRCFLKRDCQVIRVPWDYDFFKEDYDGLFISNGPGDPKKCIKTINNLKKALNENKPIFGICLGNQLLALASGADTYKMKFGHRSQNQPCLMQDTNKCFITSQNHGYAVDTKTLNKDWEPLFINVNDGTNEGIKHKTKPFFSCQFHPEAFCGPTDSEFLFDEFIKMIKKNQIK